ncbi:larval cuticle protein 16/17-like [Bicyclus anynana]|uniref:Larval cuticle protein 16/17-like n=1 Tax=Bicyclus anynana TaxID=110368 RepID=A0ABM3LHH3_BICAN|nr:larval cuticle protein 16/17-like [Bicyclus anynana]
MVKGVRFCFYAAIFYTVFVHSSSGIERQIKELVYNNNGFGTYSFEFATKDGTYRKEEGGVVTNNGRDYVVRGEYGFIDPEGRQHLVRYVADANGYRPQKDDIRFNDRRII